MSDMRTWCVGLLVLLLQGALCVAEAVDVFADGKPRVYLHVDAADLAGWAEAEGEVVPQGGAQLGTSIAEFAAYFQQMTGSALPRAAGQGLVPIRLVVEPDRQSDLGLQGCAIDVSSDGVVLTAPRRLGLQNGLFTLLDEWGCRWMMPGELGEVIPKRESLSLETGVRVIKPAYGQESVYSLHRGDMKQVGDWLRRNRMGYDRWLTGQHYWHYAIPPREYFEQHPEYYSLIGGVRTPQQLCVTNPDVIRLMKEKAIAFLREKPTAASFPMDPSDNYDHCQCENCVALDPPGTWNGHPRMADRVIWFANQVADAIKDEFPDRVVALYAYQAHHQPPVKYQPRDNVVVIITRANFCYLHVEPTDACAGQFSAEAYEDLVARWAKVANRFGVYEYNPIYWIGQLPCPIYLGHAEAVRRLNKLGATLRYVDGARPASASNFLNHYLPLREMVDPSLDPQEELASTCHAFFGRAGEPMLRYYRVLSKVTAYQHPGQPGVGGGMAGYSNLFTKEMIAEADQALADAMAAAGDAGVIHDRVAMVDGTFRYLKAYLHGIWAAESGDYEAFAAAFDEVFERIDTLGAAGELPDVEDAKRRLGTAKLKAEAAHFPDKMGLLRTWRVLGPFDNSQRDAIYRSQPFEGSAGLTLANQVRIGDDLAKWQQHESEGGFIAFDEIFAQSPKHMAFRFAYAGVKVDMAEARHVQLRMSSFNAYAVYVNGKEVFRREGLDADAPDKNKVSVSLPKGTSTILVKVCETHRTPGFQWGFYFRITDGNGNPVPSLTIQK